MYLVNRMEKGKILNSQVSSLFSNLCLDSKQARKVQVTLLTFDTRRQFSSLEWLRFFHSAHYLFLSFPSFDLGHKNAILGSTQERYMQCLEYDVARSL